MTTSNGNPVAIAIGAPPTFRHQVARALEADPETVAWIPTVAAAEGMLGESRDVPKVLVLSPGIKEPDAFGLAEFVGHSSPTTAVLLVRDRTDTMNGLLTRAMRSGIRDVIDLSRGGQELREALTRAVAWSDSLQSARGSRTDPKEDQGKIISMFSSKGGTGKTFLACNLAAGIARVSGQDTAVVDLDTTLGDVFSYFGREAGKPLQDLLALGEESDRDAVMAVGTKLHDSLWGFASPPDPAAGSVSGEAMGKVIRALRRTFAYTVIDSAAAYSDPVLAAFDLSDTICLVSGLDVVGLRHLSLALQTLNSLGFPKERFHLVLNRADSKVALQPTEVVRVMKVKLDSFIPSSRLVPTSLNKGIPVVLDEPKSDVAKAITAFAEKFVASTSAPAPARKRRFARK
jgi:pilus assembly protein CpaE